MKMKTRSNNANGMLKYRLKKERCKEGTNKQKGKLEGRW
jgi:hypothetical protein